MNIAAEIQRLKSLRDKAEGQIEAYETQRKEVKAKFKKLSSDCQEKYKCTLDDLADTLEADETKLAEYVVEAQNKYNSLTQQDEQN